MTGSAPRAGAITEVLRVERAAEWYALVTCLVVGLSHLLYPRAWAEVFAAMHRLGKPGAFVNGGLSLVPGAALVAAHHVWSWPTMALTLFGWLLVLKGAICFLAPSLALRSMSRAGAGKGREFAVGGFVLLAVAGVVGYGLWVG
jgi:uncharacterized protein YjeT (DUF2065 family)